MEKASMDCNHEIKRCLLLGRKVMTNLDSLLKSRDITNKGPSSQGCGFSSSPVWMWELDYKESWLLKSWCFWTVVLEKILNSPLESKEINQSVLKEISPEYSLEGLMLKLKLWAPDSKRWLICKDPDAGKYWRQEEKGTTEDEIVGWCHRLNGHGFGWTPGVGDGQGSLACCSPWGHKESGMIERLNWTELMLSD